MRRKIHVRRGGSFTQAPKVVNTQSAIVLHNTSYLQDAFPGTQRMTRVHSTETKEEKKPIELPTNENKYFLKFLYLDMKQRCTCKSELVENPTYIGSCDGNGCTEIVS